MTITFSDAFYAQTDKYTVKWASYLNVYGRLLDPIRENISSVLEIGVQNGGSLEVWARYFPHVKKIIGCDIDPSCGKLIYSDPRISVIVGDATDKKTKKKVLAASNTFDLIIDDGSHISADIIKAFVAYFPQVSPGGYFIIEDLHASYWASHHGGLANAESSMQFLKLLADVVNFEHWGISARRQDAFAAFSASAGLPDEKTLEDVLSVTFVNSICIIQKVDKGQKSELGLLLARGADALVGETPPELLNKPMSRHDQSQNPSAAINNLSPVHVPQERDELAKKVIELEDLNHDLVNSTSWRITRPMRALKSLFTRRSG
jgi:SAM-dependent methyltransferase